MYYKDPFDKDFRAMIDRIKEQKGLDSDDKIELTTSFVPGTTLDVNRVGISHIGFSVFDTPGLLNRSQPFNFISNIEMLKYINYKGEVTPFDINMSKGVSVWFGALIRIDCLSVI